ncbi:MAG: peptidylprolyl isomerase [Phycisphaerales bacterium]
MRTYHLRNLGVLLGAFVLASAAVAQATQPAHTEPTKEEPKKEQPKTEAPKDHAGDEKPAKERFVYINMKTSKGDIVLQLDKEKAPISVENFTKYVDKGFYDGTIFHRVISNFMIQGGGFTPDMQQKKTDAPIKNEWKNGLKNTKYTIAMARTNVPDSATSQFFINVADNAFLDQSRDGAAYAVFGKVVAGTEVVDAIKAVKTGAKGPMPSDVPVETVTIEKVTKMTDAEAAKYKDKK